MEKLWSIPAITVYLYTVTTLTQFGYNSYFNIPPNFIEFSIKWNIIYFFQLFQLASSVIGLMGWWLWIVTLAAFLGIISLFFFHKILRIVLISFSLMFLLFVIGPGSYKFGNLIAKSSSAFFIPGDQCLPINGYNSLIIPTFYETKAILIPIDLSTRKIQGGFIVKETSELHCQIDYKEIGMITSEKTILNP